MTGVVGGTLTGTELRTALDRLWQEPWYTGERVERETVGLGLLHHGDRDPTAHTVWSDGGRGGVVYGALSYPDHVDTTEQLFEAILDRPMATLPSLGGSFLVAAFDTDDRLLVATDRLGSRPCHYTVEGDFRFASEMDAVVPALDRKTVDEQAVSDMLLVGHPWGGRTLLEEVSTLSPATVLEYDGSERSTRRYWRPPQNPASAGSEYLDELASRYQQSVGACADTMSGEVGIWLSGGLDSRSLIAALDPYSGSSRFERLRAYTYDANPKAGGNPKLARAVAEEIGVDVREVELTPDGFLDVIERSVRISGGMLQWNTFFNLTSVFLLDEQDAPVLLEGAGQGELIGNHLRKHHFTGVDSAVESLYHSEASNDLETVCSVLATDRNPLKSFQQSVADSDGLTLQESVLDAHFQNYYARNTLASDQIARSRVGTRVAYLHGDFLDHAARLPLSYRMRTIPLTGGEIPCGVSPAKLGLMRRLNTPLSKIPYERTNFPPSWPWAVQVGGFVCGTAFDRLTSGQTYGGWGIPGTWYNADSGFRAYFDELIEAAQDRPFFDADALEQARERHRRREDDMMSLLAPVTTVELWLGRVLGE
jgi:asparagine synthase (glutamine-hydrolysing)